MHVATGSAADASTSPYPSSYANHHDNDIEVAERSDRNIDFNRKILNARIPSTDQQESAPLCHFGSVRGLPT